MILIRVCKTCLQEFEVDLDQSRLPRYCPACEDHIGEMMSEYDRTVESGNDERD